MCRSVCMKLIAALAIATCLCSTSDVFAQSTCCSAQATPGCDDLACQNCVCAADPFCCDTQWDGLCSGAANVGGGCAGSCPCGGQVTGACCVGDNVCAATNFANECLTLGGTWFEGQDCNAGFVCPAPPNNDFCETPVALTIGVPVVGNTSAATNDAVGTCGTSAPFNGVWFTVVGTGNTLTATTCSPTTNYDTKIQVWCNCTDFTGLFCVGGNDDAGSAFPECELSPGLFYKSRVSWCSAVGVTYNILVGSFANGDTGDFELVVTDDGVPCATPATCDGTFSGDCCAAHATPGCEDATCTACVCAQDPFCCDTAWDGLCAGAATGAACGLSCPCGAVVPPNDTCDTAQAITCDSTTELNNALATTDPTDPILSCPFGGPGQGFGSVWYTFQATHTSALVSTCNSPGGDTIIAVLDGNCLVGFIELACSEDVCGLLSELCVDNLVVGNTYYIVVTSFSTAAQGPITLDVNCPCPRACETCLGDSNADTFVDGRDVQQFSDCYLGGGNEFLCACSDINRDGDVDDDDVPGFVDRLLNNTGVCPNVCTPGHEGQLPNQVDANQSNGVVFQSADNFTAAADGSISSVRWWGGYLPAVGCPSTPDVFNIIYYDNFNGRPGAVKAGPFAVTASRALTGALIAGFVDEHVYDATHDPVAVTAGECIWISITNVPEAPGGSNCCFANGGIGCDNIDCQTCVCTADPFCCDVAWDGLCAGAANPGGACAASCPCEGGGGVQCTWFWSQSSDGNGEAVVTATPPTYPFESRVGFDFSWCLNIDVDLFACPEPIGACCTGVTCEVTNQANCSSNCCEAHGGLGCDNQICEDCVCGADPFCCDVAWDGICADAATIGACAGSCPCAGGSEWFPDQNCQEFTCPLAQLGACCLGDTCVTTQAINCVDGPFFPGQDCNAGFVCPPDSLDCCVAHGTPGCQDFSCQSCVCNLDPFCCDVAWDGICVGEAQVDCNPPCVCPIPGVCCLGDQCLDSNSLECGAFGGEFFAGQSCISFICPATPGACCSGTACFADTAGNCANVPDSDFFPFQTCLDVVCPGTIMGACCVDGVCVGNEMAANCAGNHFPGEDCTLGFTCPLDSGDCCFAHATPGCQDITCQACVCAVDPFCCNTSWDGICAGEANGAPCGPVANGGNGSCFCGGGGGGCPPGEIEDCNGNCCPATWVGDGFCDDGSFTWNGIPIFLNCPQFNNDGGDCP